jgi:hypothetical protein
MITVSISSTDEKLIVRLKHKIDYVVEKKLAKTNSFNKGTMYVFVLLFFSLSKMITKEVFMRSI